MSSVADECSIMSDNSLTVLATKPWYLVRCKPNSYRDAVANLQRQGILTFNPMEQATLRKGLRFVEVTRPLFPGYLFINCPTGVPPWKKIRSTKGVKEPVAFGENIPSVPNEVMTFLVQRWGHGSDAKTIEKLDAGDHVSVLTGPFAEFSAKIDAVESTDRVWILLNAMDSETRIAISPKKLRLRP